MNIKLNTFIQYFKNIRILFVYYTFRFVYTVKCILYLKIPGSLHHNLIFVGTSRYIKINSHNKVVFKIYSHNMYCLQSNKGKFSHTYASRRT